MLFRRSWLRTLIIRALCVAGLIKLGVLFVDWLVDDRSNQNIHPYDNLGRFDDLLYNIFLDEFTGGAVSAGYQTHQNWNKNGNLDQTIDQLCSDDRLVIDGVSLELRESLGLAFHRIPLEWARILPHGNTATINQLGIDYYQAIIQSELEHGHRPLVTLQGSELPKPLQDIGGWANEKMVQYFTDYAGLAFEKFGDKVQFWITFDEPWSAPWQGFIPETGSIPNYGPKAARNLLRAHAEAFHLYDHEFRPTQGGVLGIGLNGRWIAENATSDAEFVDSMKFELGWYCSPWVNKSETTQQASDKDYLLRKYSQMQMHSFTQEDVIKFRNTYDFFGLNYYMPDTCQAHINDECGAAPCLEKSKNLPNSSGNTCWLRIAPWGLWRLLTWVKDYYDPTMPFYIIQREEIGHNDSSATQDENRAIEL